MSKENIESNRIWKQNGERFHPGSDMEQSKKLLPGIYRYQENPFGWWLERIADRYVFPYKIYDTHDAIIERVTAAWGKLDSNLGVMLNGLKGTGKTITAQLLINWGISEGMVALVVNQPIPLAEVLEHIEQPTIVVYDEFEKTHDEAKNAGCQQALLSTIDGLSRSLYRRLFLFTTNTKKVNENLQDRPSRIRYQWEFVRVDQKLINALLDDLLNPELAHFKSDIISYLMMREILTIDVVKTVIQECNMFKESPNAFRQFMNLTERAPGEFKLEIIDGDRASLLTQYFRCQDEKDGRQLLGLMSKYGQKAFIETYCAKRKTLQISSWLGQHIEILGPTDVESEWICHVQVPLNENTWLPERLQRYGMAYRWLDDKPEDWRMPAWAQKYERREELSEDEETAQYNWDRAGTVYGTKNKKKVRVRITHDATPFRYDYKKFNDL